MAASQGDIAAQWGTLPAGFPSYQMNAMEQFPLHSRSIGPNMTVMANQSGWSTLPVQLSAQSVGPALYHTAQWPDQFQNQVAGVHMSLIADNVGQYASNNMYTMQVPLTAQSVPPLTSLSVPPQKKGVAPSLLRKISPPQNKQQPARERAAPPPPRERSAPPPSPPPRQEGDGNGIRQVVEYPVDRIVEFPVEKVVLHEVPVTVEKVVTRDTLLEVNKIVIKEVPVAIEKVVEKIIQVEVDKTSAADYEEIQRLKEAIEKAKSDAASNRSAGRERAAAPPEEIVREVIKEVPVPAPYEVVRKVEVPVERVVEVVVYRSQEPNMNGGYLTNKSEPPQSRHDARKVGAGLSLQRQESDGITYVERVVPGFAADINGQIQVGDILVAIDDESVDGYSLDAIKRLTIGDEGTSVKMGLVQASSGQHYEVVLRREIPTFLDNSNVEAHRVLLGMPGSSGHGVPVDIRSSSGSVVGQREPPPHQNPVTDVVSGLFRSPM